MTALGEAEAGDVVLLRGCYHNPTGADLDPQWESLAAARPVTRAFEVRGIWSLECVGEGRDYLGLKLDDPSFNAPIYANLFDDEEGEGFSLIWSRPNAPRGD
nr:DUF736 family protein [Mesorhizobium waimense]